MVSSIVTILVIYQLRVDAAQLLRIWKSEVQGPLGFSRGAKLRRLLETRKGPPHHSSKEYK